MAVMANGVRGVVKVEVDLAGVFLLDPALEGRVEGLIGTGVPVARAGPAARLPVRNLAAFDSDWGDCPRTTRDRMSRREAGAGRVPRSFTRIP
jgi:hypothetical protein